MGKQSGRWRSGHEIKVTVYYQERTYFSAYVENGHVSDVQHGNVTEAVVSRNSPSGYRYTWGQAYGFVDGVTVINSREVAVN